jgi:hypothetical protein
MREVQEQFCPDPASRPRVEIGVLEHDQGRLSAQLEREALEVAGGRLDDQPADLCRPGERDLVDVRMRGERRTGGLAVTGDDVEHAVRQARLAEDLLQLQCGERRLLGGLEHTGAAGRQRGRDLEHRDEERPVPGDDEATHPDRFELGEVVKALVVTEQAIGYDAAGLAMDLAHPARVVQQHLHRHLDDLLTRHLVHAVVTALEQGELVGTFPDDLGSAEKHLRATRGGQLAPHPGIEGLPRPGDGRVDYCLV